MHRKYCDQAECDCLGASNCHLCGGSGTVAIPKEDVVLNWNQTDLRGPDHCALSQ